MIEVDIQSSKDGIIVLYHDIYINYERVKSLTYEEIKEKCPTIMTLEELLNIQSNIPYYLDIKDGSISFCHLLHNIIQKYPNQIEKLYFASFHWLVIPTLKELNPSYNVGFITANSFPVDEFIRKIEPFCNFVCFDWIVLDNETLHQLKTKNILVFVYENKNLHTNHHIHKLNVDGIVSNFKCSR